MEFRALAELCERLEATTKRNLMIAMAADFLRQLNQDEVEPAISMILGRSFPKWDQRNLDVSWSTLVTVIRRLTGVDWKSFSSILKDQGDIGSTVEIVFQTNRIRKQTTLLDKPLTILEVRRMLEAMAETSGQGSRERKERLIEALIGKANALEAKYIVKVIIGEMRIGFQEGLMEAAVSKAFNILLRIIQSASLLTGDIGQVAQICKTEGRQGILRIGFTIFKPVKPMLAQMAQHPKEALKEHGGRTAFEYKLDGARIQIHKLKEEIRIFSRRLTDTTVSFPDVIQKIQENVETDECILEGEVIAVGVDSHPLPFQHLMRRFRRVHEIDRMIERIPVKLYLFDMLYVDGESLIDQPYIKRRERLREIAGGIPLTSQIVTDDQEQANKFLRRATDEGHEGLVAKRIDSPYTPGVRGKHWFKIKETLEPLDLVIVAAEYGYGRRHGWLSDYYLGARGGRQGFAIVGKTFKGLTDEEIVEMTRRLKEIAIEEEGHKVTVLPKIVVEVAYNEIQKSPRYKSGMALRFARITRIRDDKTPDEADTIEKARRIYERQFEKKAKYQ
ncbi:MAG: ATP-dependent DNA ligase [Candidatus Bathyarchaeia archaeon]